jgi:hypothetical protein
MAKEPKPWDRFPKGSPERQQAITAWRKEQGRFRAAVNNANREERRRTRAAAALAAWPAERRHPDANGAGEPSSPSSSAAPVAAPVEPVEKPPPRRWDLCEVCWLRGHRNCPTCSVANDPHLAFVNGHIEKVEHRFGEHPKWLRCLACREPYPFSYDPRCRVRDPETEPSVPISPYATTTHCPWCGAGDARAPRGRPKPPGQV